MFLSKSDNFLNFSSNVPTEFLSTSKEVIRMEMVPNDLEFFVSWPTTPGYKAYERDCQNGMYFHFYVFRCFPGLNLLYSMKRC
jgi:hypothetical protein